MHDRRRGRCRRIICPSDRSFTACACKPGPKPATTIPSWSRVVSDLIPWHPSQPPQRKSSDHVQHSGPRLRRVVAVHLRHAADDPAVSSPRLRMAPEHPRRRRERRCAHDPTAASCMRRRCSMIRCGWQQPRCARKAAICGATRLRLAGLGLGPILRLRAAAPHPAVLRLSAGKEPLAAALAAPGRRGHRLQLLKGAGVSTPKDLCTSGTLPHKQAARMPSADRYLALHGRSGRRRADVQTLQRKSSRPSCISPPAFCPRAAIERQAAVGNSTGLSPCCSARR